MSAGVDELHIDTKLDPQGTVLRTSRFVSLSILASVAAAFAVAPGAQAADDYFLKIDGVPGESVAGLAKDAIQVKEFSWGAETTVAFASGGTSAGKAAFKEFTIKKNVDSTSPVLLQKLGQGAALPAIELAVRHASATPQPFYMRYCMQPVLIVSQEHAASGDDGSIEETVVFKFAAGSQTFGRQNVSGQVTSSVIGSWNTLTNSASMALAGTGNACATSRF
jgi:type VI secretion system secreted protein Hcp